jgi:hypothetical protein
MATSRAFAQSILTYCRDLQEVPDETLEAYNTDLKEIDDAIGSLVERIEEERQH